LIGAGADRFDDDVTAIGDGISIVAHPAGERVVSRAASQHIGQGVASDAIVAAPTGRVLDVAAEGDREIVAPVVNIGNLGQIDP
jgi:hypothetical protein